MGTLRDDCGAAFVERLRKALFPTVPSADVVAAGLRDVADWIIVAEGG